ncbi:MAG: hypothetical protein V3V96_15560 [Acidiferrobacterales bacterium]
MRVTARELRDVLRTLPSAHLAKAGVINFRIPNKGKPMRPGTSGAGQILTFTRAEFRNGSKRWLDWTLEVV